MNELIDLSMNRSRTGHPLLKIKVNFQGNSDYKAALVLFLTIIFCQNICNNNPNYSNSICYNTRGIFNGIPLRKQRIAKNFRKKKNKYLTVAVILFVF